MSFYGVPMSEGGAPFYAETQSESDSASEEDWILINSPLCEESLKPLITLTDKKSCEGTADSPLRRGCDVASEITGLSSRKLPSRNGLGESLTEKYLDTGENESTRNTPLDSSSISVSSSTFADLTDLSDVFLKVWGAAALKFNAMGKAWIATTRKMACHLRFRADLYQMKLRQWLGNAFYAAYAWVDGTAIRALPVQVAEHAKHLKIQYVTQDFKSRIKALTSLKAGPSVLLLSMGTATALSLAGIGCMWINKQFLEEQLRQRDQDLQRLISHVANSNVHTVHPEGTPILTTWVHHPVLMTY